MKCLHPLEVSPYKNIKKYILVPCGKCPACLSTKRDDLAFRLDAEYNARDTLCSLFITLTYASEYVPIHVNDITGEEYMQVSPEDIHNFFKYFRKLGKNLDLRFTYFLASEYGDQFGRPHYHAIFFIKHIDSRNILEDVTKLVQTAWYRGFVKVEFPRASFSALNYVTKYVIKDVCLDLKEEYRKNFTRRSKGLGLSCIYGNTFRVGQTLKFADSENRVHILPRYYHTHIFNETQLKQHQAYTKLFVENQLEQKMYEYGMTYAQLQEYEYGMKSYHSREYLVKSASVQSDDFYNRSFNKF